MPDTFADWRLETGGWRLEAGGTEKESQASSLKPQASKALTAPDAKQQCYSAPKLVRVRVETAQMISGKRTRDEHCTRHWHDDGTSCANPD
jgi:hypothetical protein